MAARTFSVYTYTYTHTTDHHRKGDISKFVITDATDDESEVESIVKRRTVAELPVTDAFPVDVQKELAGILLTFLNNRVKAMQQALEHDAMLTTLVHSDPSRIP